MEKFRRLERWVSAEKITSNEVGAMTRGVISVSRNLEIEKSPSFTSGVIGSLRFELANLQGTSSLDLRGSTWNESCATKNSNLTADANAFDFRILGSRQQMSSAMESGIEMQTEKARKELEDQENSESWLTIIQEDAKMDSSLSLSVSNPSDCEFSQLDACSCKKSTEAASQIDIRSRSQLSSIFQAVQLSCFSFKWQKYSKERGHTDFIFQELGPRLLLSWFLPKKAYKIVYNWVVSAARCLVLSWFRGELITMLGGRFCSSSKKKREEGESRS